VDLLAALTDKWNEFPKLRDLTKPYRQPILHMLEKIQEKQF
jgi:hypothetical protein